MEGYQFAHIENWSRTRAAGSLHHQSGKRRNGATAWTVEEVLAEAERLEGHRFHLAPDGPSLEIVAGAASSFDELRELHERASSVRESFPYTDPKTGKRKTRKRKVAGNARTLHTCVFSLPVLSKDAHADPKLEEKCRSVLLQAVEHERRRVESLGGTAALSVFHWDEKNVHVHFFALDLERGRVKQLHPGQRAKQGFLDDPANAGLDGNALGKGANRAYCDALRRWQSDLHAEVFRDAGLMRVGPGRKRLTRAEYRDAKKAAADRAEDSDRKIKLNAATADLFRASRAFEAYREAAQEQIAAAEREVAEEKEKARRTLAEAATAKRSLELERARSEDYLTRIPLALAEDFIRIEEDEKAGATLFRGANFEPGVRAEGIRESQRRAPKPLRRSLARLWKSASEMAGRTATAIDGTGIAAAWLPAWQHLRTAFLEAPRRHGAPPQGTPAEQAVSLLASFIRDEDPHLSRNLSRCLANARDRKSGKGRPARQRALSQDRATGDREPSTDRDPISTSRRRGQSRQLER